ncbi:MAG: hypothetical protein JXA90_14070 [Planctomycetes bacterium]|nr:hypothetical protein [Planctomycetota bacterium]
MSRPSAERDRLLRHGEAPAAWKRVERALRQMPLGPSLEAFLSESLTLALHFLAHAEAEGWIRAVRARAHRSGELSERLEALLLAMSLRLLLSMRRYPEARRLEASIAWEAISDVRWVADLRLYWHLRHSRLGEGLRLLGSLRCPPPRPYDLASRLRILAAFHLHCGRTARCHRACKAALRHLGGDSSLRGRLLEIELRALLGQVALAEEDYGRARRELDWILDASRECHHERYIRTYSVELAWVESQLGDRREAARLLESISRFPLRTPWDVCQSVRIFQARAAIALEEGNPQEALRSVEPAQRILDAFPDERLQAHNDLLRGRAMSLRVPDDPRGLALEHLVRAEQGFRRLGERGRLGLSAALVAQGEHHLRRRATALAVQCCIESLELARLTRHLPARAQGLLLKSFLLLESDVPDPESFYEEVLRDLGVVRDPQLLFKVVSNLYMYSWTIRDGLELTDLHMRQLEQLRRRLDEKVYQRLYQDYVLSRVIERLTRPGGPLDGEEE